MIPRIANVHGFSGRPKVGQHSKRRWAERFGDRNGLVLVAAAERYAVPERWGLGVALSVVGETVGGAVLIVPDELRGERRGGLEEWAARTRVRTPLRRKPVAVVTRSQFLDPDYGLFTTRVYIGAGWCVTADEGRSLGLLAEWWAPARDPFWRGGWSLGLTGWGTVVERERRGKGREWRALLHRPTLRVKAVGPHATVARFGRAGHGGRDPEGRPAGRWERDPTTGRYGPSRGHFADLIGPAHAVDGIDDGSLGAHLSAFGLPALDVPAAVTVDPDGAQQLLDVALAIHRLALALDREAAVWFTTADDRREGRAVVGLGNLYSPGTLAAQVMERSGLTPPLVMFKQPDDEALDRWSAAIHGGWVAAHVTGLVLPVVDVDVRAAYPAASSLLGCWRVLCAQRVVTVDALPAVQRVAERVATGDLAPLFDPRTYRRLGLTLCQVILDGEHAPVEMPGDDGGAPHLVIAPVRSATAMWLTWPDVLLAALLSRRVPRLVSATRLRPIGEEPLRALPLRDGLVVAPGEDPWAALVRLRAQAKERGDTRLAGQLQPVVNAGAWGNFARGDQYRASGGRGRRSKLVERPARWSWPPIAATVPAVSRMWLGMVERLVSDAGGVIVTRDTDGVAILAAPEEGTIELPDGRPVRVLASNEVDELLAPFDQLDPFGDGRPVWKTERGSEDRPLHLLALARKRYVKLVVDADHSFELVDYTEHSLGGSVVDPPHMAGRDAERRHLWVRPVAAHAVARALGAEVFFHAPWGLPWPVLQRLQAATPQAAAQVPDALGPHPFAPLVEAGADALFAVNEPTAGTPVALDPGTDLADWQRLDWRDRRDRHLVLSTDPRAKPVIHLRTLADKAQAWARPVAPEDPGEVDVAIIRRVGRGGALVDARLANPEAAVEDHQVLYADGDPAGFILREIRRLGPAAFARTYGVPLSTVKGIASRGRTPGAPTIRRVTRVLTAGDATSPPTCALDGCNKPVLLRAGARYCSARHQRAAKERRRRKARP